MRLWGGYGRVWGWVWCFLPLSDDGGVFTASFSHVCVCHVWAWWRSASRFGNFLTPATRPSAGIFWRVLVQSFCTLLLHCPVHQVLTGGRGGSPSTESSQKTGAHSTIVEKTGRRDSERAFCCCEWMFLPFIYKEESSVWEEVSCPETERMASAFSVATHGRPESFLCSAHLKNTRNVLSPLPCLHSYLLFLQKCTPVNVNSLQKDLYVYQQMYLLDILNI